MPMKATIPKEAVAAVVRNSSGQFLLARRSAKLKFMGGSHAFPGGAIEDDDQAALDLVTGLDELALSSDRLAELDIRSQGPNKSSRASTATQQRASDCVALSRELFEETGLLLAVGNSPSSQVLANCRQQLLSGTSSFEQILLENRLLLDARRIRPAGEFVTPETSSRRFRARYYLVDLADVFGEVQLIEGELDRLEWWNADQALEAWKDSGIDLAAPVAFALQQFARTNDDREALNLLSKANAFTAHDACGHEAAAGFWVIPTLSPTLAPARHTNCVVAGLERKLIIDPAAVEPDEQKRLIETIEFAMQSGDHVEAVLVTHSHKDHIGSAELLSRHFDVPIWAHADSASTLEFDIQRTIDDGDTIELSRQREFTLRCLHTPGHHPGHLCLWEDKSKTLVAGDMVSALSTVVIPHGYGGDMTAYLNSLTRLTELAPNTLIPAHGFTMRKPVRYLEVQYEHRLVRERQIKEALDAGIRGIDDLLTACYAIPKNLRRAASLTLKAHLVRLGITDFGDE